MAYIKPSKRIKIKINISTKPKYPRFSRFSAHGKINTASTSKITNNKPNI
jgi:hypothetical protein